MKKMKMLEKRSKKLGVARNVIAVNVLLIFLKAIVAVLTGSIAVIASLTDSIFDLVGSFFAFLGIREAEKPPDKEHLYGHKKIENIAGLAQISLIMIAAGVVLFEAVRRIIWPVAVRVDVLDLTIIFVSTLIAIVIVLYLRSKKKEFVSRALEATEGSYASDVLQNSLVFVSLFFTRAGFGLADPIAAIIVAALMLRIAFKIGKKSVGELVDKSPPKRKTNKIKKIILGAKGVKGIHEFRARQVAEKIRLDVHVLFDERISLKKAHDLADEIERKTKEALPEVDDMIIHVEPANKFEVLKGKIDEFT